MFYSSLVRNIRYIVLQRLTQRLQHPIFATLRHTDCISTIACQFMLLFSKNKDAEVTNTRTWANKIYISILQQNLFFCYDWVHGTC